MSLERVVRPAQFGYIVGVGTPAKNRNTEGPERPTLEWGSGGASAFDAKLHVFNEIVEYQEQSRTVDIVRVKNTNDPSQFVDVEAVKQTTITKQNGEREITNWQPAKPTENTEIIKKDVVINRE